MLLQLVSKLPEGEHWQYEVKWDGYRGIAVIQNGEARLWFRNERDQFHKATLICRRGVWPSFATFVAFCEKRLVPNSRFG